MRKSCAWPRHPLTMPCRAEGDVPDASALIAEARRALERAHDPALEELAGQVADLGYRAADVAAALSGYLADLDETGPHELAAVEERRAVISSLVRAHGSLDEAIALLGTGSARLAELDDDSDRVERLAAERDAAASVLDDAAAALTAARTAAAERLGTAVTTELRALAMPDASLTVAVSPGAETAAGRDDVAILLSPHIGADPRPVARGASGGELSRVMLAIEVVIAAADPVPTFVFDEVDAGIGGAAAIEVGRRLARLAAVVAGDRRHSPRPGRRLRLESPDRGQGRATARSPPRTFAASRAPTARRRWLGCCRACRIPTPRSAMHVSCSDFAPKPTDRIKARDADF